jgi:hypothetical protein
LHLLSAISVITERIVVSERLSRALMCICQTNEAVAKMAQSDRLALFSW